MAPRKAKQQHKEFSEEDFEKIIKEDEDVSDDDLLKELAGHNDDDDLPEEEDDGLHDADDDEIEEEIIKQYDKEHEHAKVVNVFNKIGKPKIKPLAKIKEEDLKEEYYNLLCLLDKYNIIVHFQNDYPYKEKYRFITEEVLKQDVEDFEDSHIHINFIYEDFHPEMVEEDDEEEIY